jgi:uncharacterized membrane protein
MTKPLSLIRSLAFVSSAAVLSTAGAAQAQSQTTFAPAQSYQSVPAEMNGSVVVNGEIIGRDPDQHIRADLVRLHRNWETGGN